MAVRVFENGVPLSAVVSVEIDERRVADERALLSLMRSSRRLGYDPPMTLAQARELRDRWLAQWPEVARFFAKK